MTANQFTSTTTSNPGRKFFKCPKPKEDKEYSESFIGELMSSLDAFKNKIADLKNERDTLKEEIVVLKGINQAEMNKVLKMRVFMMISWVLFVRFVAVSIERHHTLLLIGKAPYSAADRKGTILLIGKAPYSAADRKDTIAIQPRYK
ncbi:hypothetical protein RND71_022774 [Anisodus tanguticus]|uniref:Uncharacterized protein n=1 Tax=Anisodus tanguticus TaxID=243964 RepID=A0AAE1RRB7_9SOLA|nr:hypothetical protein RND71_022774 [Anisodus tanguticus]